MGKTGWIDNEKTETAKMIYVIVDLGSGGTKRTQVNKDSVGKALRTPSSYSQVVLQQCPNIEQKLNKLCLELAKCSIAIYAQGILDIIHQATYRQVNFTPTP
jgi:hypothetical protein